jgi:hypothetical protein
VKCWIEELYTRRQGRGEQASEDTCHSPRALCDMNYQHEILSDVTERHEVFPSRHFGGRSGRTTIDALLLSQKAKDAWRRGRVATAILLDISNAFSNAVKDNLLHHLKKRRVPKEIVQFVSLILPGRGTSLQFDDYSSPWFEVRNGIGQGDGFYICTTMLTYLTFL